MTEKVEKLIVPVSSLDLICPVCDNPLRYNKGGHYEQEGMYCFTCNKFLDDIIQKEFPSFITLRVDRIKSFTKQVNKEMKEHIKTL